MAWRTGWFLAIKLLFRNAHSTSRLAITLSLFTLVLGVTIMHLAVSIGDGFSDQMVYNLTSFSGHFQIVPYTERVSDTLPYFQHDPVLLKKLNHTFSKQIDFIYPFAYYAAIAKGSTETEPVVLKGVTSEWFRSPLALRFLTMQKDTVPFCIVSELLARKLELQMGDPIHFYFFTDKVKARKLVVTGIYSTGMYELDKQVLFVPLSFLQDMLRWDSLQIQGYEVILKPSVSNPEQVAETIYHFLPISLKTVSLKEKYPEIFEWLSLQRQNVSFIIVLCFIVALFNLTTTLLIFVIERTRYVGLLKAIGGSPLLLFSWLFFSLLMINGIGIAAGNVLAFLLIFLEDTFHLVQLDPASYFVTYAPVAWSWAKFVMVDLLFLLVTVVVTVIPFLYIYFLEPRKILIYE
jgi:lipoprotein-releasing system permease protein